MKKLKKFQDDARQDLLNTTKEVWENGGKNTLLIFQSPTGSGKTFTMTKYIESVQEYANKENIEVAYLWVSIGKGGLEEQSYKSLKENLSGDTNVYRLKEVQSDNYLNGGDVVVFNWEKIRSKDGDGRWKNIAMRDGEKGNFIECLHETKNNGTRIVLIIDESHSQAKAERAEELRREIINADLTIEVSATPILKEHKKLIQVDKDDPVREEMIKRDIIINKDLLDGDTDMAILKSAFHKRKELKKLFDKEGSEINPLCLVQIPNADRGDEKIKIIEEFLHSKGVNIRNGKLAIHLTQEKVNQESDMLCQGDNDVEFLIFKQAIDTGWDCPRAHILVKYRERGSIVFELQTVGRILRMPEQKHYTEEELNNGYVYTNDKEYKIKKEEYNPNIIKRIGGKRKKTYKPIKIESFYQKRVSFGDIEADFYLGSDSVARKIFRAKFGKNEEDLKKKLNISESLKKKDTLMVNERVQSSIIDTMTDNLRRGKSEKKVEYSDSDIAHLFNEVIRQNLDGFAPVRSIPTVSQAIKIYFIEDIGIEPGGNGLIWIQNICLNNKEKFADAVRSAVIEYKPIKSKKDKERERDAEENSVWEIPIEEIYPDTDHEKKRYKRYVFDEAHVFFDSAPEKEFSGQIRRIKRCALVVEKWQRTQERKFWCEV